jgi:hypothetical protein
MSRGRRTGSTSRTQTRAALGHVQSCRGTRGYDEGHARASRGLARDARVGPRRRERKAAPVRTGLVVPRRPWARRPR